MWETPFLTPRSCSTGSSSVEVTGTPRPLRWRGRIAALGLLTGLALVGCARSETPGEDADASTRPADVELIRHRAEGPTTVALSDACRHRLPGWAEELMAGAAPLRLLVTADRIREIREGGALEVVLDDIRTFATAAETDTRAGRLLLPLDDPSFVGTPENPFVTVFRGDDEGFGSGPYRNPEGLALLHELEACAADG